ncbi:MAG TPA: VirB8/TrbF family protein [Acidobacteriota bacterium]|nr:VirB8/TrbF family protein [Acidobacteriota bacterium]
MGGSDDFIRATGHLAFVNLFLKYAVAVLGLACLGLSGALVLVSRHVGEVKPLPIFINTLTGQARPVDFQAVDARGQERLPVEVEAFVREYVGQLYTYNRLTVKSNLEQAFRCTAPDALGQVRHCADLPGRADTIARSGQGVCAVVSVSIMQAQPNLSVQAIFRKKVLTPADEVASEGQYLALLRLKVVPRTVANAHGLVVVEYNENEFQEGIQ